MSSFRFNVALGREVEFYNRVDTNDPANSALIMVVLAAVGLESDDLLRDYDTLSAILAASTNEVTNTNYARKTLTDANLSAYTVDDSSDLVTLTLPSQTFSSIAAGDSWRKVLVCYDGDTTSGTDANIIPVTAHDLLVNGAAIVPAASSIAIDFSQGWLTLRGRS